MGNNLALTNLDGLSNLTSIGGFLSITGSAVTNIDGLSNLTSIGGNLSLGSNANLTNINGLSSLTSIGGNLSLGSNANLMNIDGLSNVTSIGGSLIIQVNANLIHIDGLSNVTFVGGGLSIKENANLTNIDGLSNVTSVGLNLSIRENFVLTNIDGLSNVTFVGGGLSIKENANLTNIDGLSNLTSIGTDVYINLNPALTNIDALFNLTSINGDLSLGNNDALTNIDGLSNLTSIGADLSITSNDALTNIDALSNLTSIAADLYIGSNDALIDINGLSSLASVGGGFEIKFNSALTYCCSIKDLLNIPEAISGNVGISYNDSECSSQTEILNASCGLAVKIFNDIDQDCNDDSNEFGISNRMFMIQPGNIIQKTDLSGYWYLEYLPAGDYTITIDTSGSWSPTCSITQTFTVLDPIEETILPVFSLSSTQPCPAPNVSIHMPFMRPCFENQKIYIQACNTSDATGTLENAYVILELDSLLIPTSSSIPYIELEDHIYQFNIGTLNPGICTDFWMETTLSCDAVLGQSLCMEANLFPAEDCVFDDIPNPFPPDVNPCDTDWDMSSLTLKANCANDSIFFQIINSGSGDMTCFSPVRIYINEDLIILDSVQLVSGEIVVFAFSADGQSWRLEIDQHPLHPGNSQPNIVIEGCGGIVSDFVSYVNARHLDDADPVVDIYCGTVTGSYDPNDKTGFPLGINASHDILPNQQMEYLIRFQNTGTDTAFTVVIRDTLSTDFDIFSVESGVASHSYDFEMYGPRVLQWTFNNILLPDSTTNEPGSHGFVKFTVNQIPNLAEGTILGNSAGIYFDFNEPIITNTAEHTINYFTPNFVTTNISEEACNSYTSPNGNNTWTNSGTYYDVIETANGDSIVIIDLVINSASTGTEDYMGCQGDGYTIDVDGTIYNETNPTGTEVITGDDTFGCDSMVTINLVFNPTSTGAEDYTGYQGDGYAVDVNGTTYNEMNPSGIEVIAAGNAFGCDSTVTVNLVFNTTGIEDNGFASSINIHPNPTSNFVFVDLGKKYQEANFTLSNILGQTIFEKTLNTTNEFQFEINEASGLYLLQIETKTGESASFKILKE